ncbi:hypothetical protein DFH09DRAFT_1142055 [Mycena vulgaris]|nr:hypothetical protein DFH09DRAFT_1142055 [Mycena vulgaris]
MMRLASLCAVLFVSTTQANNNATSSEASSHSPNTAVAMIVLYAFSGGVSLIFCIIIISGAIRAIRHPERYGPRARNRDGDDQGRARGLTRAILDTFPIVKFGNPRESETSMKDIQGAINMPETETRPSTQGPSICSSPNAGEDNARPVTPLTTNGMLTHASAMGPLSILDNASQPETSKSDAIPAAIGRETCPICIVDFEEGDDLRVLPCDGAHCFHQTCVDPWLLELSTACPICRQDFIALKNMISGGPEVDDPESNHRTSRLRRFSRHLRFARHGRGQDEENRTSTHSI